MDLYTWYLRSHKISKEQLQGLLSYKGHVILRAEMMFQNGHDSNKFTKKTFDLPLLAIKYHDIDTISFLYDYIQFEDYNEYPDWMMEALVNGLKENENMSEIQKQYMTILDMFINKGLKLKKFDRFFSSIKDLNIDLELKENIISLIGQLMY